MDFKNMGAKRVCVVTDSVVKDLDAMKQVVEGLSREGIEFTIYSGCRVEPKDSSYVIFPYLMAKANPNRIRDAIDFAKPYRPDAFLAVGGGSWLA